MLELLLLGKPQVRKDGNVLTDFVSNKVRALLFYLVVTRRPHTRESLASLFWADMPDSRAKKNLRNALPNLRDLLGEYLLISRQSVAFDLESDHWLDVAVLQSSLDADLAEAPIDQLREAAMLYQGDFLEGFYVRDAALFEEWMLGQQRWLKGLAVQALHTLIERYIQAEAYADGLACANQLLTLEPWREAAHRQMMILLAPHRKAG